MTLLLTLPERPADGKKSPWEEKGVSSEDFEMARETGLIDNPDDIIDDDFAKMMEEQENILEEGLNFLDELDLYYDKRPREIEYAIDGNVYENIEVRVVSFVNMNAFGTIDGNPKVFIPWKFNKYISLNGLYRMNLKFDNTKSYPWIATHIHPKVEPYVCAHIISSTNDEYMKVHIPRQDIGKMIGKSGSNLNRILKNAEYNEPKLKELWTDGINNRKYSPKLNVHDNMNDVYTEVDVWMPKSPVNIDVDWNVLDDFVQKIYT
jgi:hypothetical protein